MKRCNGSKSKVVEVVSKKRSLVVFKFMHKDLGCKCLYGKCPNYEKRICGPGGRAVYKQYGRKAKTKQMKKVLQESRNIRG